MAAHLSETEIENIKRLFLAVDEDGSGEISVAELRSILGDRKLKMSEEDIDRFLQEFDRDGSGTIDICEFLIMMSNHKNKALIHKAIILRASMRKAFRQFDKNGDGYITKKEFKTAVKKRNGGKIPEEQLDAMMRDADLNGDGKVDYDEFIHAMIK